MEVFGMLIVGYIDSLSELGFRTPTPEWVKTERYDYCDQLIAKKENFVQMLSAFFSKLFR